MERLGEMRYALRRLARSPLFTVTAVITLAVGIGANTAIFSVVNGVLLKPLPYPDPDRLVSVRNTAPGLGFHDLPESPAVYFTLRSDADLLDDLALYFDSRASITGLERPERVETLAVTDGLLPILGVRPILGRAFTREDDAPGAPLTVILGWGYWQRAFGGAPDVLGRSLNVNGEPREIIGVLPRDFHFRSYDPAVLYPLQFDPADVFMGNFSYQGVARLKPGVTPGQAAAEVDALLPVATQRFPGPLTQSMMDQARLASLVRPLKESVVGNVRTVLWILLATVGMVLLIACANVANLFLVRAEGGAHEVAVRSALGAGRGRLASHFLTESVVLGLAGGALGLLLAWGGLRLLLALVPSGNLPRVHEIGLDPAVLGFALGVSLLAGFLFGLIPLLRFGRPDLAGSLKEAGRGGGAGRGRSRARNALVVAQVALALVLLVASGLMIRTFRSLREVDPGFRDPARVFTFGINIPEGLVDDPAQVALTHEQIVHQLEGIPGVEAVGAVSSLPLSGSGTSDPVWVRDFPVEEGQLPAVRRLKWAAPGYFDAMGMRVLAGRAMTWADVATRAPVAVVTADFAREYWDSPAAAVGRYIGSGTMGERTWREVVGVIGEVRDDGLEQDPVAVVYWPMAMNDYWDQPLLVPTSLVYTVRARADAMPGLLPRVQKAVWTVNPNLPLAEPRPMSRVLERSLARTTFTLVMLALTAAVALLLGAVGLYGVVSYSVTQRTREIGVRMALGAASADVSRMVVREGMVLVATGLVLGAAAAVALTRFMRSLLHGVAPVDPITYFAVATLLAAVAVLASWLPAHRAAATDPVHALHQE